MTRTLTPHILVVDDDAAMRDLIAAYLGENEVRVTTTDASAGMWSALADQEIDLVVLDLRLGTEDGMVIARNLRDQSAIPIIIVTGKRDNVDRILGLELGADDYITKPFDSRELLARIRAVLRRCHARTELLPVRDGRHRAYRFEGWELNLGTRRLMGPEQQRIDLTNGEFSLLQAFCTAPQRVLTRDQLLDLSRLNSAEVYDRSIDVQILRLRRKIERDPSQPQYIKTERGAGYIFDAPVEVIR
jgi:two-component system, OmpR family, response regulator